MFTGECSADGGARSTEEGYFNSNIMVPLPMRGEPVAITAESDIIRSLLGDMRRKQIYIYIDYIYITRTTLWAV